MLFSGDKRGRPLRGQGTPCVVVSKTGERRFRDWTDALAYSRTFVGPCQITRCSDGALLARRGRKYA